MGSILAKLGPASLNLPIGGVAIGLLTGCTAPFLWPMCVRQSWPKELQEAVFGDRTVYKKFLAAYSDVGVNEHTHPFVSLNRQDWNHPIRAG